MQKIFHLPPLHVAAFTLLFLPIMTIAADSSPTTVDLQLEGALFHSTPEKGSDLVLYLYETDGIWRERFMGWSGKRTPGGEKDAKDRWFNQMDHEGQILSMEEKDGTLHLEIGMIIHPDPWVKGGEARYTLTLQQKGDRYGGSYTGTFRGTKVQGKVTGKQRNTPWPAVVPDQTPFEPGEHPRILFRADDLPATRARAETPEGQEIVKRLRMLLGEGDAMPTRVQSATEAYGKKDKLPVGAYTLWHGVGFGMLYQLTGETTYADLARTSVEWALEGRRDRDPRYSFVRPGGKLRAGSSYAAVAMAYDLCYHAWDDAFRQEVARRIQDAVFAPEGKEFSKDKAMAEPTDGDLVFNTLGGQHSPHSNHYGAWNGGGGTAILAIMGDPGTDDAVTERAHRVFLQRARRALEVGYGDSAWFYEGHHGGRLNSNTGLITYLHALRTAKGLDFVEPFSGGDWLLSKWMYEIVRDEGELKSPMEGIYAAEVFERGGMSTGGDFDRGFAIAPQEHRSALKWFFENEVEPASPRSYDAKMYPHHAVFALLFWPIGEEAVPPGEILTNILRGPEERYYVFRSGWTGEGDLIATSRKGVGTFLGQGERKHFHGPVGDVQEYREQDDGTAAVIISDKEAFAADMSGLSGAPLLFVRAKDLGQRPTITHQEPAAVEGVPAALLQRFGGGGASPPPRRRAPSPRSEVATRGGDFLGTGTDTANLVRRSATVDGYGLDIITIQPGFAPRFEVEKGPSGQRLLIGDRIIRIQDNQLLLDK